MVGVVDGHAQVRLGGRSGCAACDAGKGCGAGIFSRLLRRRSLVLELYNSIGATQGQAVIVGLPERLFLGLVLRFYLLPLLAALAGAAIGHYLSWRSGASPGLIDAVAVIGAALGGALTFRWTRSQAPEFFAGPAVHLLRLAERNGTESE